MEIKINGNKIFAPLKNKELMMTPEEKVRQEYICRLVNNYGYSLEQMAQEVQVNNSQRGQGRAMSDIVVCSNSENQIFSIESFRKDKASYDKYKPKEGKDFYQFLFEQTKGNFKEADSYGEAYEKLTDKNKEELLGEVVDNDYILMSKHDYFTESCKVMITDKWNFRMVVEKGKQ